jgi:hypothetical protein
MAKRSKPTAKPEMWKVKTTAHREAATVAIPTPRSSGALVRVGQIAWTPREIRALVKVLTKVVGKLER